jgi:hypothetical protein
MWSIYGIFYSGFSKRSSCRCLRFEVTYKTGGIVIFILTSTLDGDELPDSCAGIFIPLTIEQNAGWVSANQDTYLKKKISCPFRKMSSDPSVVKPVA